MAAAAKAARSEMLQRVREGKASRGEGPGNGGQRPPRANHPHGGPRGANTGPGGARGPNGQNGQNFPRGPRPDRAERAPRFNDFEGGDQDGFSDRFDSQVGVRHDASAALAALSRRGSAPRSNNGGQPDPTRTSVDSMLDRGNRGRFGGGGGGGYGGGNRRSGGGGNRSGGGMRG